MRKHVILSRFVCGRRKVEDVMIQYGESCGVGTCFEA